MNTAWNPSIMRRGFSNSSIFEKQSIDIQYFEKFKYLVFDLRLYFIVKPNEMSLAEVANEQDKKN